MDFGSNERFLEIWKKIKYSSVFDKPEFSTVDPVKENADFFKSITTLKLLDGKWGNFCFSNEKRILAVSVSTIDMNFEKKFIPSIDILFFRKLEDQEWLKLGAYPILSTYGSKFDKSVEKSSCAIARSCIKRISALDSLSSMKSYLDKVNLQRKEFVSLMLSAI